MAQNTFTPPRDAASANSVGVCPSVLGRWCVPWLLGTVALLTGCGDSSFKQQLIQGCEAQGAPVSVCKCVADKLEDKYTEAELRAMNEHEDREKLGRYLDDMIRAVRACSP